MSLFKKEYLTFDDVLIKPSYSEISTRKYLSLSTKYVGRDFGSPIIPANMDSISGEAMVGNMRVFYGGLGILHRYYPINKLEKLKFSEVSVYGISVGSMENDLERINYVTSKAQQHKGLIICVDLAHGHSEHMKKTLQYIRMVCPSTKIIAGNVATKTAVMDLKMWGADAVKVGIGPGSVCTTRIQTGCGVPQLTAIQECSKIWGVDIIADGGIRSAGDAAKALAAGAKAVMIGGMLAGSDWCEVPNMYRGMASSEAKEEAGMPVQHIEGASFDLRYKTMIRTRDIIDGIHEGLKSALSYVGASNLKEFRRKAKFIRVSNNTRIENDAHFKTY